MRGSSPERAAREEAEPTWRSSSSVESVGNALKSSRSSRDDSPERGRSPCPPDVNPGLTNEPDIPATAAPPSNTEEILKVPRRHDSNASDTSHETEHTFEGSHIRPGRSRSRAYSARSRAQSSARSIQPEAVKVPRSERRGILARLSLVAEVTEPFDYSRRLKWIITAIVAFAGAAAPMGSSIVLPALTDIADEFNTTGTIVNLSVAMFMLSMSIFPLWWSSFSESLGRRTIYLSSFVLFIVFNVLAAVSTNVAMFIVMRILSGGAAASVQAVGAGTIADIWEVKERGRAMGFFYLGPLCGPLLSPIIGGALAQGLGWRSLQYFLAIFGVFVVVAILFALPETLKTSKPLVPTREEDETPTAMENDKDVPRPTLNRTQTQQSVRLKSKHYLSMLRRAFLDPLKIILYLQFPAVAISVLYASITFGSLYMLNISVQATFSASPYNYSSIIVGVLYIPNSLGYFLSSLLGGRWVDGIMHREARKAGRYDEKGRLKFRPEDRMKENAWIAAFLFPAALITYGWCAHFRVNVAGPMVANFFFGIGSMLIFAMITTMLTEFMPRKASHGIALNNFVRNIFSCVGGAVAEPLIDAIGNGWLFTIIGLISVVGGVLTIWAMKRFGDHWRVRMDAKMEEQMGE
ncbi:hypothetical protein MBLNU230_g4137t1 [Neophaeotheca triangularis]